MAAYWRIRLNNEYGTDFSYDAWQRNEVGIWYGAWTAEDFETAMSRSPGSMNVAAELNKLPAQRTLGWEVSREYVDTAKRFRDISEEDWVVLYLKGLQEIGLARIRGQVYSSANHPFNSNGELFKSREITDKKRFRLSVLPDAYRLLPSQGRGNVHQFNNMWEHVKLLADNRTEYESNQELSKRPFDQLLDLLGASAWESFCFAYLVLEQEFLPTGLSTGRTLPLVDIVGRRRNDGSRIVAQCKKGPRPEPIDADFRSLSASLSPSDTAYYFAYGGCTDQDPRIQVIDRTFALQWASSSNGRLYRSLLLKDS